jgi:hypothetical protein
MGVRSFAASVRGVCDGDWVCKAAPLAAAVAMTVAATELKAQAPNDGYVYACYAVTNGTVYLIDKAGGVPAPGAPTACTNKRHVEFRWKQEGDDGATGPTGASGQTGAAVRAVQRARRARRVPLVQQVLLVQRVRRVRPVRPVRLELLGQPATLAKPALLVRAELQVRQEQPD